MRLFRAAGREISGYRVALGPAPGQNGRWRGNARGEGGRSLQNYLERRGEIRCRRRLGDRQLYRPDAVDIALPVPDFRRRARRVFLRLGRTGEGGGEAAVRRMAGGCGPPNRRRGGAGSNDSPQWRIAHLRRGLLVLFRLERDRSASSRAQSRLRPRREETLVAAAAPVAGAGAGGVDCAVGARLPGRARAADPGHARDFLSRGGGGA